MMCGFSAMCEDMQEVRDRLKVIPPQRAQLESSPCYVFDMQTAQTYNIIPHENGWSIEDQNGKIVE